jgi:hypothetical protein
MQEELDDQSLMLKGSDFSVKQLEEELLESEREKQYYKTLYEQSLKKEKIEQIHSANSKIRKGVLRSNTGLLVEKRKI